MLFKERLGFPRLLAVDWPFPNKLTRSIFSYLLSVIVQRSSQEYEPLDFDLADREIIQLQTDEMNRGESSGYNTVQALPCCTVSNLFRFRV